MSQTQPTNESKTMTDQEIRETIEGYIALSEFGASEGDIGDAICDFCAAYGDRAWDIKEDVEREQL